MKKLFPATATMPSGQSARKKAYVFSALFLLTSCTSTQVRWDADNIRKQVVVYYNDQIMENLIRAKNKLPFVHVDITLLTSQGASQITGTIGAGETRTNTNASKSMAGMLGTITNAVMRPFAWSVSPQQTETLSIQAAPALGSQAIAKMSGQMTTTKKTEEIDIETDVKTLTPTPTPTATATTKKTIKTDEIDTDKIDAKTPTPTPTKITTKVTKENTQTPVTIYKLYDCFAKDPCKGGHLSHSPTEPQKGTYVPGTLKKGPTPEGRIEYYFIANNDREEYYEFCKKLFIKGQSQTGGLERALQQTQAAAALH